ncbi:protein NDRG2 isoform X2 [Pygocentrus nattereri]|nr:protein NDRG2 isoform X2 [Pygocentrus nattereri]XP_037388693.1 protein NDRG2 isoform X2 [Pygocentrus nattereri]
MTTEMQEIAITEDKPLLTGQPDAVKEAEIAARILLDQGQEHSIETPHGLLHVTVHGTGNTRRPAILTFHDVGMESKSCFSTFFKFEEMQEIVKNFTVVHVDAPGQEEGAAPYPLGYQYASMDQLAEMIPAVLQYFNFRSVIGVGVGAGAYVLSRFTLSNPDSVEGLVLVNIDPNARGWMDWAAQKISTLTSSLTEQMLSHLFSQEETSGNTELVQSHRERISKAPNLSNIELFWKSYNSRRDLNIDRNSTLKCPVMLVVGDQAPYEDAAVECNSKLDPTTTSFLKVEPIRRALPVDVGGRGTRCRYRNAPSGKNTVTAPKYQMTTLTPLRFPFLDRVSTKKREKGVGYSCPSCPEPSECKRSSSFFFFFNHLTPFLCSHALF